MDLQNEFQSLKNLVGEHARRVDEIKRDERFTSNARAAEIKKAENEARATFKARMRAVNEYIAQEIPKLEQREESLRRAAIVEPTTVEEWQEAAARAQFVKEDAAQFAKTNPSEIIRRYTDAASINLNHLRQDRVSMYLWRRAGLEALQGKSELRDLQQAIAEHESSPARELEPLTKQRDELQKWQIRFVTELHFINEYSVASRF